MRKKDETYNTGQKVSEQKGDTLTWFYKDGTIKAKGKSIHDSMEGKWIFNRPSGELCQVGNFSNNQKHGEWIRYDKKGEIEYHAEFREGKLVNKLK
jgi:antitoxin component YwqK of YwqJK toxin-antitoxin module